MHAAGQVEVEPSPIFQRDGYDVVVPRTIDFTDAILGTSLRWGPGRVLSDDMVQQGT